jgi:integrase
MVRAHCSKWSGVYYYELATFHNGKHDRCYYFAYRVARKLVWKKVGKASEGYGPEVAAELRAKTIMGLASGEDVLTPKEEREDLFEHNQTFGELARLYFEVKGDQLKGIQPDRNRYEKHLSPRFDNKRVGQIQPSDIERLKKDMRKTHQPATIWNTLEMLRRIINFGVRMKRCPALDFQLEMPVKDNEIVEYLRPDEAQRFLEVVRNWPDHDVGNILQVAYFTGMRRGELFKLEDRDIDFHLNLIRIRAPKGGKTSSIGMSGTVADILRAQLVEKKERFPDSPYVFPGQSGGLRVDCSAVDNIRKAAGLPKTFRPFHGLRHHFAVTLANSGKFTMNMISAALTHKNADFTRKKYAQFLPETLAAMGNAAAEVLQFKKDTV